MLVIPPRLGGLLLKLAVLLGPVAGLIQLLEERGGPGPVLGRGLVVGAPFLAGQGAEGGINLDGTGGVVQNHGHGGGSCIAIAIGRAGVQCTRPATCSRAEGQSLNPTRTSYPSVDRSSSPIYGIFLDATEIPPSRLHLLPRPEWALQSGPRERIAGRAA